MNLHSNIGSAIITCSYTHKSVKTFGALDIRVDNDNDTLTILKRF